MAFAEHIASWWRVFEILSWRAQIGKKTASKPNIPPQASILAGNFSLNMVFLKCVQRLIPQAECGLLSGP